MSLIKESSTTPMPISTHIPLEIWHIETLSDPDKLSQLSALLSPEEQRRAQKTIKALARNTYTTSHAAMRMILGQYLRQAPQSLEFITHQEGKPSLKGQTGLHFNLSHTHDYALLGVSSQCSIGIDIEISKHTRDILAIAKRFFSDTEYSWLANTAVEQRYDCFSQLWCHKEAYLKALGVGLQGGLSSFSLTREDLLNTCSVKDSNQQDWWLHTLNVPDHYRAAVAVNCIDMHPVEQTWKIEDFS